MTDYISREAAKENIGALLRQMFQECEDTRLKWAYQDGVKDAIIRLLAIPAADVREVERGKWEDDGYGWVRCSICRGAIAVARGGNRFNYCPNCGADMRSLQNANNLKEMEEQNG